ncbi:excinuclease ABC subunit A [Candidatus Shapirobacteria bacterium CG_4_10_14_0_2_um_filter_40_12]|uniref:UvrABC system protein A n=1 Tax=Candidatus Shapirobacteria bacterium CG_4_10_14_0_2_um_filter_40_12 TaxID=1974871 RepID=A0A2M7TRF0_9BACT|nr:MAG: excinuclease ABC subunit A [Candidatus Shapirobacteria bacterium CG_4_10_14_0_2_um_filter_40_12]
MLDKIIVKGARENNLKNVSFAIPKNKFVVFTGVSGSGKSSMAFDTLFAEGQRRYVESLSSYARQFLGGLKRPDVDLIEGLSPAIAINQKAISHNPRSTVGTVTEIYDYLRLLFARIGHPHCPNCGREVIPQTVKQIVTQILDTVKLETFVASYRFLIMSPLIREKAGDFRGLLDNLKKQAFKYIRADGKIIDLYSDFGLTKTNKHNLDVVCDRISVTGESLKNDETGLISRLTDSVEQALKFSNGLCIFGKVTDSDFDFPEAPKNIADTLYSENYACPVCNLSIPALEPRLFSFNSPSGACLDCHGLGSKYQIDRSKIPEWKAQYLESRYFNPATPDTVREELEQFMIKKQCLTCNGARLNPEALSVHILSKNIYQICLFPIDDLFSWLNNLGQALANPKEKEILEPIKREIHSRLEFLLAVGLDYLSLDREAGTLSSGESQRIRLASQIGTGLTGVLYILDEPTIGLHPRDNNRLIATLKKLESLGNTVVVVEHDASVIKNADYIVDFGPLAGNKGGEIVAFGTYNQILKNKKSLTGQYLSGKKQISSHVETLHATSLPNINNNQKITITNCRQWNLKNINVDFPLHQLVCVTGVSGSGKSTLVHDTLFGGVRKATLGAYYGTIGQYDTITGCEYVNDVLLVDQSPIGRTPRSNPATYTKVFDDIRELMAQTTESKIRGFGPGRFSFNVKNGRCEACEGQGQIKIEMQFLADIYVTCDQCHGTRFKDDTLEVTYKNKNIADILNLTFDDAADFFKNISSLRRKINTIQEVGLGYLKLGQPSNTLSGGESQRLKISRELVKKINGRILYILDEPTTGLHFYDIDKLIKVLRRLVDMGNTVVVIEHNLDVIKNADWIIDLGPDGGHRGGEVVAAGTVADIIASPRSYTGQYLKSLHGQSKKSS